MTEKDTIIKVQTLAPFGPTMLFTHIPQYVVDNYNEYCDKIIADEKMSKAFDYSNQLEKHYVVFPKTYKNLHSKTCKPLL